MARQSKVNPALDEFMSGNKTAGSRKSAYSKPATLTPDAATRSPTNVRAEKMDQGLPLSPVRKRK